MKLKLWFKKKSWKAFRNFERRCCLHESLEEGQNSQFWTFIISSVVLQTHVPGTERQEWQKPGAQDSEPFQHWERSLTGRAAIKKSSVRLLIVQSGIIIINMCYLIRYCDQYVHYDKVVSSTCAIWPGFISNMCNATRYFPYVRYPCSGITRIINMCDMTRYYHQYVRFDPIL